jgi:hypothetical protein
MENLADAVQRRLPTMRWNLQRSTNDLKPLDLVATFVLPGREDHQLVVSMMFTRFGGTMEANCDLMLEEGPILSEIPTRDLGADPTPDSISTAAGEFEAHLLNAEEVIVRTLES